MDKKIKIWIKNNLFNKNGHIKRNVFNVKLQQNDKQCLQIIKMTSFLENPSIPERLYCIINDITNKIECKDEKCKNYVSFSNFRKGYRTYCSKQCVNNNSIEIKEKIKQTCLEKYGVENISQLEETKIKKINKYIKNYGVDNPNKCNSIKEKIKQTCLEKYGVENISQLEETKIKKLHKCLKNYGVTNLSHSNDVKERVKKTIFDKYGTEHYLQSEDFKKKQENTCLEKYGTKHYLQSEDFKYKVKNTCLEKYGVESPNQKNMDIESLEKINNKEWLINRHHIDKKSLSKIAQELNVSTTLISRSFFNHGIKVQNYFSSLYEEELLNFINIDNIKTNTRDIIPPYELDIYIPDYKLAIEFNGLYWHSKKDKNYHLNKTQMCLQKNIQLLHIFENEWLDPIKQDIWKSIINNKLSRNTKIYSKKCKIKEITDNNLVKEFLNNNHLKGNISSSIKIGLFYNNELVSLMISGKTRFSKKYEWEMIGFCNKKFLNVINGFSKLYKYFIKSYKPRNIISHDDRRYSNEELYNKLGFKFNHYSDPKYWYFKNGSYELYNKAKFQKHKLKNLLELFDENKSEIENMMNNNYLYIFDCGNAVYTMENK